jgi:hypothetical protein
MLPVNSSSSLSSAFSDFTGRQLRVALLRTRIIGNEIATMGVALKAGLVSPENAIAHLVDVGASGLLTWESSR